MVKPGIVVIFIVLLYAEYFAQLKPFGYKISGNGDIISDVFFIKEGFVLDSAASLNGTFRFEYDENGRLERDINFLRSYVIDSVTGRPKSVPGFRDYFYNERGDVDSVRTGILNGTQPEPDPEGYRISYAYDDEGNILSKSYSENGAAYRIEENNYDSSGNLILIRIIIPEIQDTTVTIREYDSQNRLIKTVTDNQPSYDIQQVTYQYDTSGNINLTIQSIKDDTLVFNEWHYYLEFDQSGKMVYQVQSRNYNPDDSTWMENNEILCDYDEDGNIVNMGDIVRYHYNTDGNLDSLFNTHPIYSGYMGGTKGRLIDTYGNSITFPEFWLMGYLYYSSFVTGIGGDKPNDLSFNLSQNYPNPFNPTTSITYSLPKNSVVTLKIYDMLGKEIATLVNEEKQSGTYNTIWNASDIASGVYFYKITAGEYSKTNKMLLLK